MPNRLLLALVLPSLACARAPRTTTTTTASTGSTMPVVVASATSAPGYHVTAHARLGGAGGWDYLSVDTVGHRLYLSRGTHVMVVDTRTDSVVGDIPDTPGVHGIAVAPDLNRGFTSNGRDSSITVFDLGTLAPVMRVKIQGVNPDAIAYDAASQRVFTFNGRSNDATVVDAKTGAIVGTIPLGGKPEFAQTDGKGTLWVNVEDKSEIAAVDTRTLAVKAHWSIAPCEEPSGLAIDRAHRRLFAVCGNALMAVVDADNGKVVATVPIGQGTDAAAFDPRTQLAFSSNGEGSITVVHEDAPDRFSVVETVPTQRGARTMTIDPTTGTLYTVTAEFGPTPEATADRPRPRPPMLPDSFTLLVLSR